MLSRKAAYPNPATDIINTGAITTHAELDGEQRLRSKRDPEEGDPAAY